MKRFNRKIFILAMLIAFGGLFFASASLAAAQGPDFSNVPPEVAQHLAQLRAEIKKKNYRFSVGYNPAMEYSIEKLCGLKSPPEWKEIAEQNKKSRNVLRDFGDLPGSFDWRALGGVTSVKNQGNCGSCWAFGTVVPMESAIKIFLGQTVNLSEQYLVSCNNEGMGCGGGWWAHDYHWWKVPSGETEPGAVYESDFPYTATDASCNPPHPHAFVLNSWDYVGGSSPAVADIKQAIYTYGPVAAAVAVGDYFQAYTGGVFDKDEASNNINHAIGLVGWNDDYYGNGSNVGVWILKNSWGPWWGDDGFMYITYGTSMVGYAATYVEMGLGCENAITLTPNVAYNGTTVSGNSYVDEYGCIDWNEAGPEIVHKITAHYTGAEVTATLSNLSSDLHVFILNACDPNSCVAHGDITATYANAPAGTYYIVVDGYMGVSGSYTLIVTTGLDCSNAITLTPNVPYNGTTVDGNSNVDIYGCTGWNETGPEIVHRITAFMSGGDITATLSDLSVNLDVFILSACDPVSCVAYGDTAATYHNAPVGPYFIVVDGRDGASGTYTLTANALLAPGNGLPFLVPLLLSD